MLFETRYSCISPGTEMRTLGGKQAGARFPLIPGYAMLEIVASSRTGRDDEEGTLALLAGTKYAAGVNLCWGGHVSHAVADAERLFPISEDIDPIQAVAAQLASIAYHGLRLAHPLPEEKVAVIGLGCIGHCAAKLCTLPRGLIPSRATCRRTVWHEPPPPASRPLWQGRR